MKQLILLTLLAMGLFVGGCATVDFEETKPDGTVIKIAYKRAGNQKIESFKMGDIEIAGQESNVPTWEWTPFGMVRSGKEVAK